MSRGEALFVSVALLPARPRLRVGCGRPGGGVASPTPISMALRTGPGGRRWEYSLVVDSAVLRC
ncbi:hypothetical protein EV385_6668 [Krasilnikovia cinnamomea]|uniref:Uncharacterized protein n=1 Tax=Krasilnikovia cinnamomea TaxID=349313 RepID=A0A4Q7Z9Q2_9ACTN|nr:hypothetical protein EV385_6668 [Krasilnikovia cinnamomea]